MGDITLDLTQRVIITCSFCNIYTMQVCAVKDASDEEILDVCNKGNPAGTANGWAKVIRGRDNTLLSMERNEEPVTCESYPDRLHFLVLC